MSEIAKMLRYAAFVLLALSQHALAETTDVSGRWTGKTVCPGGSMVFTIDIEGRTGTFSYGPNKKPLSYPVKISTETGWEGEWVYFTPANSGQRGSLDYFNGLLSANGRTLTVRPGVGIGDCRGFSLARSAVPSSQPSSTVAGPPQGREPTEEEMRAAVEYSLHGDAESLEINNPLNGASASIDQLEKLNCEPHKGKPGYFCDYILSVSLQFHSNEGTVDGNKHADAVQKLYDWLNGGSNAREAIVSSRFLYVKSKNRWMRFKD